MIRNSALSIFAFILLTLSSSFGQTPLVPDKIRFADLELKLSDALRREIQKDVNDLTASKKYFQIKVDRADQYIPIVERIFEEEGVPDDFKYLAIQESAYISDAVSSSNAIGFWQFKIPAAKEVGLKIDRQVDERKNIVAATRGAAKYLKKNNFYFNNWVYALLAYQTGRGGAEKYAEEKNFGKKQMSLKKNTYWYVKKYLAHKIAFQDAVGKNSNPEVILTEYTRGKNQSLKAIAKETSTELELLKEYNKWLKRGTVPDDKEYTVIVPLTNGNKKKYLASIQKSRKADISTENGRHPKIEGTLRPPTVTIIKVNGIDALIAGSDDTLESLSERGGISQDRLASYNDMSFNDAIIAGQVYYLRPKKSRARIHYHTLLASEDLWSISQRYGIKLNKLIQKNRISLTDELKPGRVLWLRKKRSAKTPVEYRKLISEKETEKPVKTIPKPVIKEKPESAIDSVSLKEEKEEEEGEVFTDSLSVSSTDSAKVDTLTVVLNKKVPDPEEKINEEELEKPSPKENDKAPVSAEDSIHIVEKGETLYSISRRYKLTLKDILAANSMEQADALSIGQKLIIPVSKEVSVESRSSLKTHIVKTGDTLYGIARKYQVSVEDILKWNNKSDYDLKIDEELIVEHSDTSD